MGKDRVLVVAAHPDDEVLGCGATIARLASEGHEVFVGILGEGLTSRSDDPEAAEGKKAVEVLHALARRVSENLGAVGFFSERFPDNRFDSVPLLEIAKAVEKWVAEVKPRVVYTHHAGDLNVDHVLAQRAVLTATRPQPGFWVKELYAFEVQSSTEWAFSQFVPFRPNVFVDVDETLEAKVAALVLYQDEMRDFPHPRSLEAVRASAQRWGSVAGVRAAEAFELIRCLR